jgi:hypothetical protein
MAIQDLSKGLEKALDTVELINTEEGYFGIPPMRFPHIQQLTNALDPYLKLWSIADNFKRCEEEWMISWLNKLDTEKIENEVKKSEDNSRILLTQFFLIRVLFHRRPDPLRVG